MTASEPPDGGPIYCETGHGAWGMAEPWNTVSEVAFLAVVLVWAWRLRGRWREHLFVSCALPLVFVAFVGGLLFHGLRAHRGFLLLDILPIIALLVATVAYLCYRISRRVWVAVLYVAAFLTTNRLLFALLDLGLAIPLNYAVAAAFIAAPILIEARRAGGRGLRDIALGIGFVALGTVCNAIDGRVCGALAMGTHWLWHVFAAVAVHFVLRYLVGTREAARAS